MRKFQYTLTWPDCVQEELFITEDEIIKQYKDQFVSEFQVDYLEYTDKDCVCDFVSMYNARRVWE